MASFLAPYQNVAALNVARELNAKEEALLASATLLAVFVLNTDEKELVTPIAK
jgi:hypothetical protein